MTEREGEVWEAISEIQQAIIRLEERFHEMSEQQAHLDSDVGQLQASTQLIVAEIANLKAQPGGATLDFTALDAAVGALASVPDPVTPPANPAVSQTGKAKL